VLDRAHRGDIEGAWGTVGMFDTAPRTLLRRRLATLAAVMGPGVIVMANDAGGLSLFAQAGQDHGFRLLWLVTLLAPVLFVNQEMVARLGAVTGAGHARLIYERFGRRWGRFALADLLVLNVLTIVTEFIGVALACGYFGVSHMVSVPVAALALVAVTVRGSFRGWERAMFGAVVGSLVVVPLAAVALSHGPSVSAIPEVTTHPLGTHDVLFVIALVGTTVAPWQLFFQQSNVVDKRVTSRWVGYVRADLAVGTALFAVSACAVLVTCAATLSHRAGGGFVDAGHVATALGSSLGTWAGALFAVALLNASLLGAAAVTLSTSYAIGDATGLRHSLHRPWKQARTFHGSFVTMIVLAAAVVLIPAAPLGLVTVMVNVLAGVLLPSATVFLVLLSNDRAVLGPWTNPPWLNVLATAVVCELVALSALVVFTTLFPRVLVPPLVLGLTGLTIATGVVGALGWTRRLGRGPRAAASDERSAWTMPPLETLPPPRRSRARTVGLVALRGYLVLAAALVTLKAVQLITG
jgi:Mn2+/Fe2+ NRAMP family transporter